MIAYWIAFLSGLALVGGIGLWRANRLLYAGLYFLLSLLAVAGLFVCASADFVAVAQIVVYVGGILVLLLFGMMFMSAGNAEVLDLRPRTPLLAVVGVFFLALALLKEVQAAVRLLPEAAVLAPQETTAMSQTLVVDQALSFELVAVLLLVALIGATFIAARA
ncbi:MAG: NADH-quinone oxidoreductase subunit J [Bernardetiaceae bacterium]